MRTSHNEHGPGRSHDGLSLHHNQQKPKRRPSERERSALRETLQEERPGRNREQDTGRATGTLHTGGDVEGSNLEQEIQGMLDSWCSLTSGHVCEGVSRTDKHLNQ